MGAQLSKAMKRFYELSFAPLCKDIAVAKRLQRFCCKVRPVALSGCAAWTFSRVGLARIQSWENLLLRKVVDSEKGG